jgi:hypothetical protein
LVVDVSSDHVGHAKAQPGRVQPLDIRLNLGMFHVMRRIVFAAGFDFRNDFRISVKFLPDAFAHEFLLSSR